MAEPIEIVAMGVGIRAPCQIRRKLPGPAYRTTLVWHFWSRQERKPETSKPWIHP